MTSRCRITIMISMVLLIMSCTTVCEHARWLPVCESDFSIHLRKIQAVESKYYKVRKQVINDIPIDRIEEYYNNEFLQLGKFINVLVVESKQLDESNPEYENWKDRVLEAEARMIQLENEYKIEYGEIILKENK